MPLAKTVSADVRATLQEFINEGLTNAEAAKLLNCTPNQASSALWAMWKHGLAIRTPEPRQRGIAIKYRYFPTGKPVDFRELSTFPLGGKRIRRLKLVTPPTKPRIYINEQGVWSYDKVRIGSPEHRSEVNYRAATFVRKLNKKSNQSKE